MLHILLPNHPWHCDQEVHNNSNVNIYAFTFNGCTIILKPMKITATPRKNEELKKANNIHSTQIDETDELRKDYVKGEAEDRSTELKGEMQKL